MKRPALPLFVVFVYFLCGCAEPEPTAPPQATPAPASAVSAEPPCHILMGWDPWEPYQYQDVDGNLRGLDVELVRAFASTAGCSIEFVEGRWGTLVRQLQEGEVDMLTGASRTPARESFAYFSEPYRTEDFKLYVRKDEIANYTAADISSLMQGEFVLGVTEQFSYGDAVSRLQEDPRLADKFLGATVGELNYSRLLEFKIDGFLDDPFVAARAFRMRNLGDQIAVHPIAINSGDVDLMFSKISVAPETVQKIDAAIRGMKADGRHQAIVDKYLQ